MMKQPRINRPWRFWIAVGAVLGISALSSVGAIVKGGEAAALKPVALSARAFDLKQVRLLDGPFRDAMERDRRYLHELESERLLYPFRVNAGLPAPGEPMGGWEQTEVRGHTMGHYLTACALMVASTGDEKLKAKADAIVAELAKCQEALGPSGFLSAFPESFIDRVEAIEPVWAPYYGVHKIMAGLVDMYVHCGNRQALEMADRIAAWSKSRCDKLDDDHVQNMLNHTEQGGMNDVLANLAAATGNADYLALSRRFVQNSYNEPLAAGRDELKGQHVNSFVPNMIGTARLYELTGDPVDHGIATFFWDQVTSARCYSTGGTSFHEHWRSDPHQLADQLGHQTQETCCTYNMLKLTRHLFTWSPEPKYADYYERALWNSILATQDPQTGMMMYFVPLASGYWKYFNTPRDSFWCCTGTGLENHAKYGDSIYFHDEAGLWVNLFIASELDWSDRGVRIRQETRFPEEEGTSLVVHAEKPVRLAIRVRVPGWATRGVGVSLNGEPLDLEAEPASYLVVDREWSDGDRLDVELPMSLWAWPMPDDPTLLTVMYGPLVLAGKLGGEGLSE
ncbi:MAG: glycoside hydrolase family 127 protein, partial [Planctomycetota bacterium]